MAAASFHVTVSKKFDALIVVLPGTEYDSLSDAGTVDRVRQTLFHLVNEMERTHLVLDLSTVRQFGASFLGIVVELAKRLHERDKQLVVCGDRLGLFRLANLHSQFPVSHDLRQGLQWCSQARERCVA